MLMLLCLVVACLQGKHRIEYLDGERATQDLDEEQWRLLLQVRPVGWGGGSRHNYAWC